MITFPVTKYSFNGGNSRKTKLIIRNVYVTLEELIFDVGKISGIIIMEWIKIIKLTTYLYQYRTGKIDIIREKVVPIIS